MGCPALKFESFHFVDEGEAIRREFCMTGEAVDISGKTVYAYDKLGWMINGVVCADDIEDEIDAKDKAPK